MLQSLASARQRQFRYRGFLRSHTTTTCRDELVFGSWAIHIAEPFFSWANLLCKMSSSFGEDIDSDD
jgi:hypothetical protein